MHILPRVVRVLFSVFPTLAGYFVRLGFVIEYNRRVAFAIRTENEKCDVISTDLKANMTKVDITFSHNVELVDEQLVVFG